MTLLLGNRIITNLYLCSQKVHYLKKIGMDLSIQQYPIHEGLKVTINDSMQGLLGCVNSLIST